MATIIRLKKRQASKLHECAEKMYKTSKKLMKYIEEEIMEGVDDFDERNGGSGGSGNMGGGRGGGGFRDDDWDEDDDEDDDEDMNERRGVPGTGRYGRRRYGRRRRY